MWLKKNSVLTNVQHRKQNEMRFVQQLVGQISTLLYSDDVPPESTSDLFLMRVAISKKTVHSQQCRQNIQTRSA